MGAHQGGAGTIMIALEVEEGDVLLAGHKKHLSSSLFLSGLIPHKDLKKKAQQVSFV